MRGIWPKIYRKKKNRKQRGMEKSRRKVILVVRLTDLKKKN